MSGFSNWRANTDRYAGAIHSEANMNWLHRDWTGDYLNESGLAGRGSLIGTVSDQFVRALLTTWRGSELLWVDAPDCPSGDSEQPLRLLREPGHQAAAGLADASLDFVYLGETAAVATDLQTWQPKLRRGGLFAGSGYTGVVKNAVDELALDLGIVPAFTSADSDTPDWFFRIPLSVPPAADRIALVTGYDVGYAAVGELSRPNKSAYCKKHGYQFICHTDDFDTDRPASWSKLRFVLEALQSAEWVYWSDADSLVMNSVIPLTRYCWDSADLVLSGDPYHGINLGCFLARRTDWTRAFFERVYAMTEFVEHPWWENAAVYSLYAAQPEVRRRVAVVPNALFNGYPYPGGGYEAGGFVVHVPGVGSNRRLALLRHYAALTR